MSIADVIYENGIVGAGGAGFPSHIKFSTNNIEYLIVNGAECEPLLEVDKFIMRNNTLEIIKALDLLRKELNAKETFIAVKGKYREEIKKMKNVIEELNLKISIFEMTTFYPAGDEQMIVYEITGKTVPELGIPLDVGAIVTNVGTLLNIYEAVYEKKPVIDKYISIHGEVNNPTLIKVPIGISVKECLEAAGGVKIKNYKILLGGPMMGNIIKSTQINDTFITKTIGALIILPENHYIFERKEKSIKKIINETRSACIQCQMCTDLCPRYLIGHKLRPHKIMRSIGMSEKNSDDIFKETLLCCECGICELYACPMGLSPRMVNVYIKNILRKAGIKIEKSKKIFQSNEMRKYRKIPTERLISRINLNKYSDFHSDDILKKIETLKVSIPLKQHIGVIAEPVVNIGDIVEKGVLIGKVDRSQLGANIHSSISGLIVGINQNIVIEYKEVK